MESRASSTSPEPHPYGWDSSTSGSQDQTEHSLMTTETSPEHTERQIEHMPAALTFPLDHHLVDLSKRRRLDEHIGQSVQAQDGFSSDAVKALFNIGQSSDTNFSRLYANPNPSVWTQPVPVLFGRPEAFHSSAQPLASARDGNAYQESVLASNQLRATASGFVPSTPTRGRSNGIAEDGCEGSSSIVSPHNTGGISINGFDPMPPLGFSHPSSSLLPGLGAVQRSQDSLYPSVFWNSDLRPQLPSTVDTSKPGSSSNNNNGTINSIAQEASQASTTKQQDADMQSDSSRQVVMASSSPGTPQTKVVVSNASRILSSAKESVPSSTPEKREPAGPPVVWREKQTARTFKMQRVIHDRRQETFGGAFEILGTMNPDHYQMPNYSKVVCIKSSNLDNILLSIQTGLWTCNANVMKRIMALFDERRSDKEKILMFWSIPGSKNFCGLTELQGFDKNVVTDFVMGENESNKGALIVRWLFCKLVAYDDLRHLEGPEEKDSITQMWNGMHYTDKLGREVVQGYVEAPHVENLLVRPRGDFFRRALANSRFAPNPRPQNNNNNNGQNNHSSGNSSGPYRGQHRQFPSNAQRKASIPPLRISNGQEFATRARSDTNGNETDGGTQQSSTSAQKGPVEEPKLQLMPVLIHADGTMTPAPHMQGMLKTLDSMDSLSSIQRSNMQDSTYHSGRSNQSSSQALGSANYTPFTTSSKFPSMEPLSQRKSAMTLPDGRDRIGQDMAPSGPSLIPQQPASMADIRAAVNNRSSSSSMNRLQQNHDAWSYTNSSPSRFQRNIDTWSYNKNNHGGLHTPMRKAFHSTIALDGSPIGKPESTPRLTRRPPQFVSGYGYGGAQDMQSGQHLSGQPGTPVRPVSSPMSVKAQTPSQQVTPRPITTFGHRSRDSDVFSSLELRTNHWINDLIGSPSNNPES